MNVRDFIPGWFGWCSRCRKNAYTTRKNARRAAKNLHPDGRLNAYRCPAGIGWHFGHLHPDDRNRLQRQNNPHQERQ
ncbi:hypothetical protein GCM10012275_38470 [Longimycelium tulufanense]|uniref:Uncharacterized protein n=1 Tax=Longimycelium tulufanense TaxID=907463 RepID=A0A8J3CG77_9PSEU|nr:hypothetical protein [Longimycelium tulufanense]GGM64228.1 hypothetical protein GCM10012275_38470 [Longimycelium tulufanense]